MNRLIGSTSGIVLALVCPLAWGSVFSGTLGRSAIVVELPDGHDAGEQARYFYRRHGLDIDLEAGQAPAGTLVFGEIADWRSDADSRPRWELRPRAGGGYQGWWQGADGRRLPIVLAPVAPSQLPAPADPALEALRLEQPYVFLRLSTLPLRKGRLEVRGGYRLQWWDEPRTGVSLFQVESGYAPALQLRINQALRRHQWDEVESGMECLSGNGASGGEWDSTTTLHRIDAKVISASLFASYYCGGAHPDFGDSPVNLDARSGGELSLEDVLWLGQGTPPRRESASEAERDAWMDYRTRVFAPWVAARMARLYPDEVKDDGEDGCDYTDQDSWDFPSWHVTEKGLYLGATFYRAARNCDGPDWSVLPWRVVREHPGKVDLAP
ncbi:hypothetical protein [Stenotrophomonas sp. MMGLT7]|uniref:hypothetical protein n=1 Tax=Stenotrophomonas sp. MMGLT7 TaxID=2901227 RepID=UPI001E3ACE1E|nr:hypothetical protein [Stenotrophomonas sp. MMGLT7]MCD7097408.1 hypothetical protein [Stenotrophomonas sp. MMGLT7]